MSTVTTSEWKFKPSASDYSGLHKAAKSGWCARSSRSRNPADQSVSNARRGLPSGDSTDGETVGIKTLGRWQRSHKGLDPASAAILSYLIEVATQGVATCRQTTIAVRAGLSVSTVGRRLDLLQHVGLISREKRTGKHKRRLCDAISLMLDCQPVKLSGARSKELVRQFNGTVRTGGDTKNQTADGETDVKILDGEAPTLTGGPSVNLTEPLSHDVSYFPPYPVSSVSPQSQGGAPAERGCDAPATPSITDAGDPGFQIEDGRPKDGQGIAPAVAPAPAEAPDPAADDALDGPSPLYDEPVREADDGAEFREDDRLSAGYARDTRARVTTTGLGTRDRARPSRKAPRRTSENRSSEAKSLIWRESLPKMIALRVMLGHAISDRTARKRIGQLVKVYGPAIISSALVATIDAGPGGCPFDYATKTAEGLTTDRTVEQNIFRAPIDYC